MPTTARKLSRQHVKNAVQLLKLFGLKGVWFAFKILMTQGRCNATFRNKILRHPVRLRGRSSDVKLFNQLIAKGEYDLPNALNPSVIIDGGANIGISTALFASRFPTAMVIAVEPDWENFCQLLHNTLRYENVVCINAAIWSKSSLMPLLDVGYGTVGFRLEGACDESTKKVKCRGVVSTTSINEICKILNLEQIDFLKLDIEGSEWEVLCCDNDWLYIVDTLAVELHEMPNKRFETLSGISELFRYRWKCGEYTMLSKSLESSR